MQKVLIVLLGLLLFLVPDTSRADRVWTYVSVLSQLKSVQSVRSHFVQEKKIQALSRPLRSEGTFMYLSGKGILWATQKPFPASFSISDRGISQQTTQGRESILVKDNPALERITSLFLSLFRADKDELEQKFATSFENLGEAWQLTLTPKDLLASSVMRDITLRGTDVVQSITLTERSGDQTSIQFTATVKDHPFSDEERAAFE